MAKKKLSVGGVKITAVRSIKYEVRDLNGKRLKSFTTSQAARAWVAGYLAATRRNLKPVTGGSNG